MKIIKRIKGKYVNFLIEKHIHTKLPKGVKKLHEIVNRKYMENKGLNPTMYFIFHGQSTETFQRQWTFYEIKRNMELREINPITRKYLKLDLVEEEFKFKIPIIFNNKFNGKNHVELVELGTNFKVIEKGTSMHQDNDAILEEERDGIIADSMPEISIRLMTESSKDKVTIYKYEEFFGTPALVV